ncbi:MAG: hypothetical protein LBE71_02055 [Dysgonamonadaceae bacterium]|jgi:hypothetical protein|nr:hypothetical protein [Dysgonamonadaceae bacterium]
MEIMFILFIIILIVVIGFFGYTATLNNKRDRELLQTVTKLYRGTRSERNMVLKLLKQGTFITYSEGVIDVINTIMTNNEPANYTDKYEVIRVLKDAVQNGDNGEIKIKHIENIKEMLSKDRIYD